MLLEDLNVILKVAEFRSITAAAANLDMRTATASAAVKRVENALGIELFIRTTRQLRLSPAGEKYLPECEKALAVLEQAKQSAKEDLQTIDGELRVAVSSDLGRNLIIPWVDELMDVYPKLSLRTNVSDTNIDFYRDSVDMALRYGSPQDSNLYGFKICNVPRLLCASPDYLKRHSEPMHPDDLVAHNGLFYQIHEVLQDTWQFHDETQKFKVRLKGNRASNDGDLVRRWCVAGKGVAVKSGLDIAADLISGKVVHLMPDYRVPSSELWLICPSRQSITPVVRLLRDTLRANTQQVLSQLVERGIIAKSELD
ncbi:LysR family transcriptional regulator [Vibrio profundi]|uniref:LysR family transcriptional regulator n=1 Tax=Vibrio profundi TaxID=1774960 RepID=UPI00373519F7